MPQLTKNFRREEFDCRDGTIVPKELMDNLIRLAEELQKVRDEINEPIMIASGYRTEEHNLKVGGVKGSQHLLAKAADIIVKHKTSADMHHIIEKMINNSKVWFGGIGLYRGFLHVDIRDHPARWSNMD